jgi:hypothetical protein
MIKLEFGKGNAKLNTAIAIFDLPAGHSCPSAMDCLCKANRDTGIQTTGKDAKFRCFAATAESAFTPTRNKRWRNFDALKACNTVESIANLIQASLPFGMKYIRVHSSGDFYNEKYFVAWLNVAVNNPDMIFYGYTKQLFFLVKYKQQIPSNFRFTASKGGKLDFLIDTHKLKFAEVVYSVKEAADKGLEIDHDDSHAIDSNKSFALLLHGCQPKGTPAAAALKVLRASGLGSYGKGNAELQPDPAKIRISVKMTNGRKELAHA